MLPSKVGTSILGNLTPLVIVAGDSVDGLGMTPGVRVNSNFLSCRLQSKISLSMAFTEVSTSSAPRENAV